MIRTVLLVAALAFGPATMAIAAPPPAPKIETPAEAEAYLGAIMRELSAYAAPHQAAIVESDEIVLMAIDGASKALELQQAGTSKRKGAAWADEWQPQLEARIAALRATKAQLPPFPEATFNRLAAIAPEMGPKRSGYAQIAVQTGTTIDVAATFAENTAGLARRVATGDEDALIPLAAELIRGTKLVLSAENATLDIAIATGSPDHPQTALSRSMKASNVGVELFMDYQISLILQEESNAAEVGAKIRAEGQAARKAALLTDTLTTSTVAKLKTMPDIPLKPRLLEMAATYRESSAVEVEIADLVISAGDALINRNLTDEELDSLLDPLDAAVDRRVEITRRRLKLLNP